MHDDAERGSQEQSRVERKDNHHKLKSGITEEETNGWRGSVMPSDLFASDKGFRKAHRYLHFLSLSKRKVEKRISYNKQVN